MSRPVLFFVTALAFALLAVGQWHFNRQLSDYHAQAQAQRAALLQREQANRALIVENHALLLRIEALLGTGR